jgi:hypothetical protein
VSLLLFDLFGCYFCTKDSFFVMSEARHDTVESAWRTAVHLKVSNDALGTQCKSQS